LLHKIFILSFIFAGLGSLGFQGAGDSFASNGTSAAQQNSSQPGAQQPAAKRPKTEKTSNPKIDKIIPALRDYIEKARNQWGAPGVAVVIVKDGKIVYEEGFGEREIGSKKPVDEFTIMPLASLTKNFLATLLAQLVDDGALKWDDPVIKHLPDFKLSDPEITKKFTVNDLVSHKSGLKHFSGDTFWELGFTQEEILKNLSELPFKTLVGGEYGYQNHMFGIASMLVEKVTGKTIAQLFKERLFTPLKMNRTSVGPVAIEKENPIKQWFKNLLGKKTDDDFVADENFALPHHIVGGKTFPLKDYGRMYLFNGSSGVNSCAHDLGLWMMFHLSEYKKDGKQIVSLPSINHTKTPHIKMDNLRADDIQFNSERMSDLSYGVGWFMGKYSAPLAADPSAKASVEFMGHMGGFGGVRSLMCLVPSENLGIAIISNFGSMRVSMLPESIRNKFLDMYLGIKEKDWSTEDLNAMNKIRDSNFKIKNGWRLQSPRAANDLAVYVGKYKNELYGEFEIKENNGALLMVYRGKNVPLKHWNGNEFEFNGPDLSPLYSDYHNGFIEFGVNDKKASVAYVNLMFEGSDNLFKRV